MNRKLFEPQLYPNSLVFQHFDKYFGVHASRNTREVKTLSGCSGKNIFISKVCAVGFEPNKKHTESLKKLEERYNQENMKHFNFNI